ncbi:MAG: hypothetical protein DRI56_00315 [Chloroflexota bacterium]|nr:MAG: hypothetical protein DRI56_00315 [Chloroflexota bacterium]
MKKTLLVIFSVLVASSMLLAACATPEPEKIIETVVVTEKETVIETVEVEVVKEVEVEVAPEVAPEPITLDGYSTTDIPTLDPQLGEDVVSINYIENLFVHLTNYDLITAEIIPEAATSWVVNETGDQYTFTIRTDIPWVYHNPVTGETTQEVDDEGNPRFVTAYDFQYGIRRGCDPNNGSYYSGIIAGVIKGCEEVYNYEDPTAIPQELKDAIGATALDAETLVIDLKFPAGYFMSMTPMWTMAASPEWAIEEHGTDWIEAGNIVTNGRYVLDEWVHGVRRVVVRNPLMPEDMQGGGNVERIVTNVVPDTSTGYALWLNNEVDTSGIPDAELEAHLAAHADETVQVPDLAVFYFAFRMTKPPFDNVHVRRAFSAAFDRQTYVDELRQGQGLPMKHWAPPGIFGAPPIDEVGVGYDPEYAREQLAEAGYPNCEGFPEVTLLGYSGQSTLNWIEFAQANWAENLGCSPDLIQIEQQSFADLLTSTKAEDAEAPHMWTLGWGPDYADENNWVGDVLDCNIEVRMHRTCNEIDEKLEEARTASDPEVRIALYREIEDMFFGPEGEFPIMPLYVRIAYTAEHSWLTRNVALFGGQMWYTYTIDQDAKLAAQGK